MTISKLYNCDIKWKDSGTESEVVIAVGQYDETVSEAVDNMVFYYVEDEAELESLTNIENETEDFTVLTYEEKK